MVLILTHRESIETHASWDFAFVMQPLDTTHWQHIMTSNELTRHLMWLLFYDQPNNLRNLNTINLIYNLQQFCVKSLDDGDCISAMLPLFCHQRSSPFLSLLSCIASSSFASDRIPRPLAFDDHIVNKCEYSALWSLAVACSHHLLGITTLSSSSSSHQEIHHTAFLLLSCSFQKFQSPCAFLVC